MQIFKTQLTYRKRSMILLLVHNLVIIELKRQRRSVSTSESQTLVTLEN